MSTYVPTNRLTCVLTNVHEHSNISMFGWLPDLFWSYADRHRLTLARACPHANILQTRKLMYNTLPSELDLRHCNLCRCASSTARYWDLWPAPALRGLHLCTYVQLSHPHLRLCTVSCCLPNGSGGLTRKTTRTGCKDIIGSPRGHSWKRPVERRWRREDEPRPKQEKTLNVTEVGSKQVYRKRLPQVKASRHGQT